MNAWARIEYGSQIDPSAVLNALKQAGAPAKDGAAKQEVEFLLRGLGTVMNFARGSTIFSAGGNANAVYKVISGAVTLWRALPNGKRHIADFRMPGEFFGILHRPAETINAEATSDCIILAFRRGLVDEICDAVPSFRRSISMLTAEPALSRRELAEQESLTAKERIARLLLGAAERAAAAGEIVLPFTGENIAERIDSPRELVASALRDLQELGAVVRTNDGGLAVINPALLKSQG